MLVVRGDNGITMPFPVSGCAHNAMSANDVSMIATSFPQFEDLMRHLGAQFEAVA